MTASVRLGMATKANPVGNDDLSIVGPGVDLVTLFIQLGLNPVAFSLVNICQTRQK